MVAFLVGNIPQDCHPKVRALAEYWRSIHPLAGLPGRQHVDPCNIPKSLLPNLLLVDIDGAARRFTWRLMGTGLVKIFERDHTGLPFESAYHKRHEANAYKDLLVLISGKEPRWRRAPASFQRNRDYLTIERAFFPLAGNGDMVDMAFGIILARLTSGEVV
jgi:hypothetical protein